MYKKIFAILFLIFSLNCVYSKTIDSVTFIEHGDLAVIRDETKCKEYTFEKLEEEDNSKLFLNLLFENYTPTKNKIEIDVYFNDVFINHIDQENIKQKTQIEIKEAQTKNNVVKICVNNQALPKLTVSKKSNIETHLLGVIEDADFYQKILIDNKYTHELIPIEIYAHNSGHDRLNIKIIHANEIFLQNSNLETVSGETNYDGVIEAGETVTLKYYLKTNRNIEFATPRAKLTYTDDFGEEKIIYAKQENLKVNENQNKIEVHLDLEKEILVNTSKQGKIILKNTSQTEIKNINIETNFDGKIIMTKRNIPVLDRFEIIEIPFEITTDEVRNYTFNTTVYYNLGNIETGITTQTITLNAITKKDYLKETIGILLLVAIAIYVWIVRI